MTTETAAVAVPFEQPLLAEVRDACDDAEALWTTDPVAAAARLVEGRAALEVALDTLCPLAVARPPRATVRSVRR